MSVVSVGGIEIGYDDQGGGEPVVLIHGHPFDRSMWRPQVERFSREGYRMIVPDLRGFGETTVVPGATTLDVFARDIAGLLDQLEIDRFVLGGLSMGGQIVLEFHRLFAGRLRGIVLADTFATVDTEDGRRARIAMADRLQREGMGPYANEVLPKMLTPSNVGALPDVAQHVLGMMRGAPSEGAAAAARGRAERPDYTEMLARIAVPTLVVVGSDDAYTPVADAEFMADRIPGARLVVIDGAGHMPNLERPAEFNTALGDFLEKDMRG